MTETPTRLVHQVYRPPTVRKHGAPLRLAPVPSGGIEEAPRATVGRLPVRALTGSGRPPRQASIWRATSYVTTVSIESPAPARGVGADLTRPVGAGLGRLLARPPRDRHDAACSAVDHQRAALEAVELVQRVGRGLEVADPVVHPLGGPGTRADPCVHGPPVVMERHPSGGCRGRYPLGAHRVGLPVKSSSSRPKAQIGATR